MDILDYYSKPEIQKEIVLASKDREIAVQFADKGFGKRPDIIQYEGDVLELAKQGATSFHVSEEHWTNPLELEPGMTKVQLDNLRKGWDCVLDIDSPDFEYSRIASALLIDALRFHDVKNMGIKFSGNKGFHIIIPYKAFPSIVNGQSTKYLFPDGIRTIAAYLKDMIKEPLSKKLSEIGVDEADPFKIVDVDTILISSRHMYRAPYSINEKSGLVSVPIKPDDIQTFSKEQAKMENVKMDIKFMPDVVENEAEKLITQAFDKDTKRTFEVKIEKKTHQEYEMPKVKIKPEFFPPCVLKILEGIKTDGRKRALFILLNFLQNAGWDLESIDKLLTEWNKKNYEPLKEGYIRSQLNWHKKQNKKILPPNCDNVSYYTNLQVCCKDNLCKLVKNPVNYTFRRLRLKSKQKSKK